MRVWTVIQKIHLSIMVNSFACLNLYPFSSEGIKLLKNATCTEKRLMTEMDNDRNFLDIRYDITTSSTTNRRQLYISKQRVLDSYGITASVLRSCINKFTKRAAYRRRLYRSETSSFFSQSLTRSRMTQEESDRLYIYKNGSVQQLREYFFELKLASMGGTQDLLAAAPDESCCICYETFGTQKLEFVIYNGCNHLVCFGCAISWFLEKQWVLNYVIYKS